VPRLVTLICFFFFKIFKDYHDIRYATFLIGRIISFYVRYILILELKKINLFLLIYEIINLYVRYIPNINKKTIFYVVISVVTYFWVPKK
jgi:hypothetical protein